MKVKSSLVRDFNYGEVSSFDMYLEDNPVMSIIEYDSLGNIIYEDYSKLDDYLENYILKNQIFIRKIEPYKGYKTIRLSFLLSLRLSEAEYRHIFNYLKERNILISSKDSILNDDEVCYFNYKSYKSKTLPASLTNEENEELFNQYAITKDKNIRERLILGNMRLTVYMIKKIGLFPLADSYELESYANEGLIKAVDSFDVTKGYNFSTWAIPLIIYNIYNGILESYGCKNSVHSIELIKIIRKNLDLKSSILEIEALFKNGNIFPSERDRFIGIIKETIFKSDFDEVDKETIVSSECVEAKVMRKSYFKDIKNIIEKAKELTDLERKSILCNYGFESKKTLRELAKEENISYQSVLNARRKGESKLRKYLLDYLQEERDFTEGEREHIRKLSL